MLAVILLAAGVGTADADLCRLMAMHETQYVRARMVVDDADASQRRAMRRMLADGVRDGLSPGRMRNTDAVCGTDAHGARMRLLDRLDALDGR